MSFEKAQQPNPDEGGGKKDAPDSTYVSEIEENAIKYLKGERKPVDEDGDDYEDESEDIGGGMSSDYNGKIEDNKT